MYGHISFEFDVINIFKMYTKTNISLILNVTDKLENVLI